MLQGFETRTTTDIPVQAFVDSTVGRMYKKVKEVGQYEKTQWPDWKEDYTNPIAVFGILRGTADLIANSNEWYYFDHAYLFGNKHKPSKIFGEKIYRLTKNWYHIREITKLNKSDYERIEKYKPHIELKPWKYDGDYILVCPPSEHIQKYFNKQNWLKDTIKKIKKHTRKEIKIRTKESKTSLQKDIDNAYCVVSCQSTVCINAIMSGVPSFCDDISMGVPVSLTDLSLIKDPLYPGDREMWINSLLANQFTMTEIINGKAWRKVR
tara:strand:- start:174 stop:971 length:798 start_codon:yes stop_codon:yes gene_type:complete